MMSRDRRLQVVEAIEEPVMTSLWCARAAHMAFARQRRAVRSGRRRGLISVGAGRRRSRRSAALAMSPLIASTAAAGSPSAIASMIGSCPFR